MTAPGETQGWKAGSKTSFCASCKTEATAAEFVSKSNASSSGAELEDQNTSKSVKKSTTTSQTARRNHSNIKGQKRKCLDLSTIIAVINFAKDPSFGSKKIEEFGTGKTQIQTILRNKESIFVLYESNVGPSQQKRSRTGKYSNVNIALWDWYTMCRSSNIPVSATILQEATIITEKFGITGFAASNGWLESFKRQHNIGNMKVSGEAGGVRRHC